MSLLNHSFFRAAIPLPPDKISLLSSNPLTFNWRRPSLSNGCQVQYKITSSNCGTCPSSVTLPEAACESAVPVPEQICQFSVQTVICDEIVESAIQTFIHSRNSGTSTTTTTTTGMGSVQPSNGNYT